MCWQNTCGDKLADKITQKLIFKFDARRSASCFKFHGSLFDLHKNILQAYFKFSLVSLIQNCLLFLQEQTNLIIMVHYMMQDHWRSV